MNKLLKIKESKEKIREAIKKININLTDDIPFIKYYEYLIEQKQKEEAYADAVAFWKVRTDNGKNFANIFDEINLLSDGIAGYAIENLIMDNNVSDVRYLIREVTYLNYSLDLSNWDTSGITKFNHFAEGNILYLGNWDLSKVEDMSYAFCNCSLMTRDDQEIHLTTPNVKNMHLAFYNIPFQGAEKCTITFDTHNVIDMSEAFCSCKFFNDQLKGPTNFNFLDLSNVENMDYAFTKSYGYLNISDININNCNSITGLFFDTNYTILDISNWNITNNITLTDTFADSKIGILRMNNCNANTLKIIIDEIINAQLPDPTEIHCKYDELIQVYSNPDNLTNITFVYV